MAKTKDCVRKDTPKKKKSMMNYYSVFGRRESLHRFVVEDGVKPAIFGSYSYDPVKQVFIPLPADATQSVIPNQNNNGSYYSTAMEHAYHIQHTDHAGHIQHTDHAGHIEHMDHAGHTKHDHPHGPHLDNHTDSVFRKHVTANALRKNTAWWIRPKLTMKTSTSHKLNKL